MEASTPTPFDRGAGDGAPDGGPSNRKALTIGSVAKILGREFDTASPRRILERLRERPAETLAGEPAASG